LREELHSRSLHPQIAEERKLGQRLVRGHPMLEAEVVYCAQHEYCLTAHDFLAHRTRLAFLDVAAARAALPRVVRLHSGGYSEGDTERETQRERQQRGRHSEGDTVRETQ
jgi:glycerol-3-phosphate dehydrogenase